VLARRDLTLPTLSFEKGGQPSGRLFLPVSDEGGIQSHGLVSFEGPRRIRCRGRRAACPYRGRHCLAVSITGGGSKLLAALSFGGGQTRFTNQLKPYAKTYSTTNRSLSARSKIAKRLGEIAERQPVGETACDDTAIERNLCGFHRRLNGAAAGCDRGRNRILPCHLCRDACRFVSFVVAVNSHFVLSGDESQCTPRLYARKNMIADREKSGRPIGFR
jgi:hypothetical protein